MTGWIYATYAVILSLVFLHGMFTQALEFFHWPSVRLFLALLSLSSFKSFVYSTDNTPDLRKLDWKKIVLPVTTKFHVLPKMSNNPFSFVPVYPKSLDPDLQILPVTHQISSFCSTIDLVCEKTFQGHSFLLRKNYEKPLILWFPVFEFPPKLWLLDILSAFISSTQT